MIIINLLTKVVDEVLDETEIKKGIGVIMGGKVLKLAYDDVRAEGRAEGREEGVSMLAQAIDKLRSGVSFDEVKAEYGENIANLAKVYR